MQSALLRTIAAVLRAGAEDPGTSSAAVLAELEGVEREIAELPRTDRPMLDLAQRLGWGVHEIDFVWVTLALAADPRMLVHARALDPGAAQGMSPALYSRIARLDATSSLAIGRAMHPDRPLPRSGLLVGAPGTWLPTSTPWSPVTELLHYLLREHGEQLPIGVTQIEEPAEIVLDDDQREAIHMMRATLAREILHARSPASVVSFGLPQRRSSSSRIAFPSTGAAPGWTRNLMREMRPLVIDTVALDMPRSHSPGGSSRIASVGSLETIHRE
ncbi:MAG: hypothetical protein H0T46_07265 [Deltaproteobacteria bacterium]|nr:hypothetical protein [Deltaproteobacteria bacterium]